MELNQTLNIPQGDIFKEMLESGVIYGHKKSRTHPKMKSCIFSTRNGIELLDLEIVLSAIDKAKDFLKKKTAEGGVALFVATQPAAQKLIENFAQKHNSPYMTQRWLGGTLTNFKVINQRVVYYLGLKAKREQGELDKYTKKERVKIDKEIAKMEKAFSGITGLNKLPNVLFVIDSGEHRTAINEARLLNIPIVAIMSTDCDPATADYSIPANDHSKNSIEWIMKYLEPALVKSEIKLDAEKDEKA